MAKAYINRVDNRKNSGSNFTVVIYIYRQQRGFRESIITNLSQ